MWSWARLSRLRVVFLIESDDRGTCFLSCSRQCLNWARLQCRTSNIRVHLLASDLSLTIRKHECYAKITTRLNLIKINKWLPVFLNFVVHRPAVKRRDRRLWGAECKAWRTLAVKLQNHALLSVTLLCNVFTYCHQQISSYSSVCFSCQNDLDLEEERKHTHVQPLCTKTHYSCYKTGSQ